MPPLKVPTRSRARSARPTSVSERSMAAFDEAASMAVADPQVKGVIITSARPEFIVGADLNMMLAIEDAPGMMRFVTDLHALMRGIETGGKPFVAAINGTALGGGYELALACHRRIAADNPKALIGLPELFRVTADYRMLIYGITLLLLVRYRPQGLLGTA